MREILFRGKRVDNGEWIEGLYNVGYFPFDGQNIAYIKQYIERNDKHIPSGEYEVIPETVGQYTGLTDKNGKKIFEGDILTDGKFIGVVTYNAVIAAFIVEINDTTDKCYHWSPLNEGDIDRHAMLKYTEIIGNIHDNPELLGEEPYAAESEGGNDGRFED